MEKTENKRLYYLDMIKIISAFMITFYHTAYYRLDYGFVEGSMYIPNINRVLISLCAMSVPLFFMVSGALMLNKRRTIKYMAYKVFKIILLIAVWYVTGFPMWFFRTLILLYVLTPLLKWLFDKHRRIIYIIMAAIFIMPFVYNYAVTAIKLCGISVSFAVAGRSIELGSLSRTGLFTLYSVLYYLLGAILINSRTWHRGISILLIAAGWAMVIAEVTILTNIEGVMFDGVNASFPTIGALLMAAGAFELLKSFSYKGAAVRFTEFVSPYVLSIYVMHMIIIKGLTAVLHINNMSFIAALALAVAVDMIAVAAGWVINKIPYVREVIRI